VLADEYMYRAWDIVSKSYLRGRREMGV
jgi:hypothetical protein